MADLIFWLNLGLIGVGLLFVLIEVLQPGFFIAAVGSTMALVGMIGLLFPAFYTQGPWTILLILLIGVPATAVNMLAYKKWAPAGDKPITLSADSLPGMEGVVEREIPAGDTGRVRIHGQVWRAVAPEALPAKSRIRVVSVDGLTLTVEKLE